MKKYSVIINVNGKIEFLINIKRFRRSIKDNILVFVSDDQIYYYNWNFVNYYNVRLMED